MGSREKGIKKERSREKESRNEGSREKGSKKERRWMKENRKEEGKRGK